MKKRRVTTKDEIRRSTAFRYMAFLMIGVLIMGVVQPMMATVAEEEAAWKEKMDNIKKRQDENAQAIEGSQALEVEIRQILDELDKLIAAAEAELSAKEKALEQAEAQVKDSEERVEQKKTEVSDRQALMRARACAQYEEGNARTLEMLLKAESLSELLAKTEYLRLFEEKDQALLDSLRISQQELEAEQANLVVHMGMARTAKDEAVHAKNDLDEKKEAQKDALERNEKVLADLRKHDEELNKQSEKIRQEYEQWQEELKKSGQVAGNGVISVWPVPVSRSISSDYKTLRRPRHGGIDVAGVVNQKEVVAAGDGIVFSIVNCGVVGYGGSAYGNYVEIDHGDGTSTLYAHLYWSSDVKPGLKLWDRVSAGQVIGYVGSTGNSTGPHLHFEVRKNGVPVSPWAYYNQQDVVFLPGSR